MDKEIVNKINKVINTREEKYSQTKYPRLIKAKKLSRI